jgi:hypothetical protein
MLINMEFKRTKYTTLCFPPHPPDCVSSWAGSFEDGKVRRAIKKSLFKKEYVVRNISEKLK